MLQGLFYTDSCGIKYTYSISKNNSNIVLSEDEKEKPEEGFEGPIFSYDFTFKKRNGHRHRGHHRRNRVNDRRDKNRDELKESKKYGSRTANESIITEDNEIKLRVDKGQDNRDKPSVSKEAADMGEAKSSVKSNKPVIEEDNFGEGVYLNEAVEEESDEPAKTDSGPGISLKSYYK